MCESQELEDREESPEFNTPDELLVWLRNLLWTTASSDYTDSVLAWAESDEFLTEPFAIKNGEYKEKWSVVL